MNNWTTAILSVQKGSSVRVAAYRVSQQTDGDNIYANDSAYWNRLDFVQQ